MQNLGFVQTRHAQDLIENYGFVDGVFMQWLNFQRIYDRF